MGCYYSLKNPIKKKTIHAVPPTTTRPIIFRSLNDPVGFNISDIENSIHPTPTNKLK